MEKFGQHLTMRDSYDISDVGSYPAIRQEGGLDTKEEWTYGDGALVSLWSPFEVGAVWKHGRRHPGRDESAARRVLRTTHECLGERSSVGARLQCARDQGRRGRLLRSSRRSRKRGQRLDHR